MKKRVAVQHADWLSLIEPAGAFLTLPVLRRAFPQGLDVTPPELRAAVRESLEALGDADESGRTPWLRFLLTDLLEYGHQLIEGPAIPLSLQHTVAEYGVTLRPDFVLMSPGDGPKPRLLVCRWPLHTPFDGWQKDLPRADDRWAASPIERAATLCRETNVPLALVTDSDRFTLVYAPRKAATGWATWPSSLFAEERTLLDSFVSVLGMRRFFAVAANETLESLFAESASAQAEVTNQLGKQVRAAVELLVAAISRADRAIRGELLRDVREAEVYNAAVTVMMRLVFLLSAEEKRLFPVDDDLYLSSYAISSLRAQLEEQATREGEEVLEHRQAAWHRVLATFRAAFGGIQHDRLSLPAYGGGLFDPDRYPFLEGRAAGTSWRDTESHPLPIDDRTMLAVLDALQVLTFRQGGVTEARHLSYRSLDIEQIGHVYEGLLDHGCVRARGAVLGLKGGKGLEPEIALDEFEVQRAKRDTAFIEWLQEETGRSANQLAKDLAAALEPLRRQHLLAACDNDHRIFERVAPFAGLVRDDLRGLPTVFLGPATYDDGKVPGAIYVTKTSERRDSGTQYTTKELADEIVRYALEPIVYFPGPAEGAEPAEWRLKSSAALLKLKVCDPAVGSGAILVAACRYLAERLVEAWRDEMARDVPPAGLPPGFMPGEEDLELLARRVITDHCLFGVDRNPMAAEMAKLSLWLTTVAKDRPFTFLDHAIHAGDSLLGITSLEQLEAFHLDPKKGRELHQQGHEKTNWGIEKVLAKRREAAIEYGRKLSSITVLDQRDAREKQALHEKLTRELSDLEAVGDLLVGATLATAGKGERALEGELKRAMFEYLRPAYEKAQTMAEFQARVEDIRNQGAYLLDTGRPALAPERRCLHWPLAFPEVFLDPERPAGFDAMVGNPPFLGGKRISGPMGTEFREFLVEHIADGRKGNADLVAYFYLRAAGVSRGIGMLATNTIAQGDTREVGLDWLLGAGRWTAHRAVKSRPWPGEASLEVAQLWLRGGRWDGIKSLDGESVPAITAQLEPQGRTRGMPQRLVANGARSFIGCALNAIGFVLNNDEANGLLAEPLNAAVVKPYLTGEDLNDNPSQRASRWVIDFADWPRGRADAYPSCMRLLEERVFPVCLAKQEGYPGRIERWWQFWNTRPGMRAAVAPLEQVLVMGIISKTMLPALVSTSQVFSHKVVVFVYDDHFHFGLLTSAFHWWWSLTYSSTMRRDPNYSPSDVFETFFQPPYSGAVEAAGKALDDHRRPLMIANNEGLTKTYNRVHNPAEQSAGIVRLRELHRELDCAVRDAYGWQGLELDHGFHETSQGVRYTIGPAARTEVLDRLLELNHQRYAEEVAAGLHDKKKRAAKAKARQKVSHQAPMLPEGEDE
jgi:hypothetical protein